MEGPSRNCACSSWSTTLTKIRDCALSALRAWRSVSGIIESATVTIHLKTHHYSAMVKLRFYLLQASNLFANVHFWWLANFSWLHPFRVAKTSIFDVVKCFKPRFLLGQIQHLLLGFSAPFLRCFASIYAGKNLPMNLCYAGDLHIHPATQLLEVLYFVGFKFGLHFAWCSFCFAGFAPHAGNNSSS